MNFATKCKELRIKKGVTQEQMASALNLTAQAISKWENGLTLPDIELLPNISVFFGITIDELFSITDDRHLNRIQNMIFLQNIISDTDFVYAQNFLLNHLENTTISEKCFELLPALYNAKANEYRRKATYYAMESLKQYPENHNNHANLNEAQQGTCGDWNLDNKSGRIEYYKIFTKNNPSSIEGLQWYIEELLHTQRCNEASAAIEKLRILIQDSPDPIANNNIYRLSKYEILLLLAQGNHAKALMALDKQIGEHSDNWFVWNYAGDIYAKACQYDKAIHCYEQCILLQPKPRYTDSAMAIAQICEITGDTSRSINAWKTYIEILTNDWNTSESVHIEQAMKKINELQSSN